ncbi:HNH endonuclease signature motif containing protein [Phytohabitans rumicis]|uniref:HNH endonuclease signature motif containing protein n=1 Tax=Phytohabitans rumicis TaxID=1076125 RepID=UPI0031E85DFD
MIFARLYDNGWVMPDVLTQLKATADASVSTPTWSLRDEDLVECLDAVHAITQAVAALQSRLVREIDSRGLAITQHASSTKAWLREHLRISPHAAKRMLELAQALDARPVLAKAVADGLVNTEQAQIIAAAIQQLPADVVGKAEKAMISRAAEFEPNTLRRYGEGILAYVAPELAEAADAEALERMEARARQTRAFHLTRHGDGRVRLTGWLDEDGAATVNAALDPLCAPRHDVDVRTPAQRRADALVEICDLAMRTEDLPESGGERPHVVVTVSFDVLRLALGVGTLDTGERLSPEQVRRLACDAKIIPAVLGGDGQILDLGRTRRLISGPLRRALELRDKGCAFPGCDRPPRWCYGHHIRSWADGGPTTFGQQRHVVRLPPSADPSWTLDGPDRRGRDARVHPARVRGPGAPATPQHLPPSRVRAGRAERTASPSMDITTWLGVEGSGHTAPAGSTTSAACQLSRAP